MDYEKAYNEAKNRASCRFAKWIVDEIFTELAESEDEKIKKAIKEAVCYYWNDDTQAKTDCLSWLEKQKNIVEEYEDKLDRCACESWDKGYKACLEKQKKEWSEEDGILLHNVLKDLEQLEKSANIEQLKDVYQKEIDWLNSLKPRWKPSEEQLRAIMDSAQGLYQCKEKEVLLDLYEQLKNL